MSGNPFGQAPLSGIREDIIAAFSLVVGKDKATRMMNDFEGLIKAKAKEGAEAAIPKIKEEVKKTVTPYVYAAIGAGGVGIVVGLVAILLARRSRSETSARTPQLEPALADHRRRR